MLAEHFRIIGEITNIEVISVNLIVGRWRFYGLNYKD